MSRPNIAKHYARLLTIWPKDILRPEIQFQSVIQARAAKAGSLVGQEANTELLKINALYSLIEGRYAKKYPHPAALLTPESDPDYYKKLEREIEEVPNRTWWQDKMKRLSGLIRRH